YTASCVDLALGIAPCTLRPFFYSFHCFRPHRHLLSFPTRRSSDLWPCGTRMRRRPAVSADAGKRCAEPRLGDWTVTVMFLGSSRSEEHTSELQSLRHLVCRLLLEKKKKTALTFHQNDPIDIVPT